MTLDIITLLLIAGAGLFSLAAAVGAARFPDLLSRLHAASKPQLLGLVLVAAAIAIQEFHWGPVTTLFLVVLFQLFTVPVAAHMVGRAGYRTKHLRRSMLYRDELSEAVARAQAREVAARERDSRGEEERPREQPHEES